MLNSFRVVSVLEGLSYLTILSVTLSIISRDYVFFVGMGHGILFMIYIFLSLLIVNKQQWSFNIWLLLFLASIIPFAFIPVELYLRKAFTNHASVTA